MKSISFFAIGLFFAWLFYERFWKWRDCINDAMSSCVTPDGDNLIAGGMIWGFFALIFFALGLISLLISRFRR